MNSESTKYHDPKIWDVIIAGGGLAGLTLAKQLRKEIPEINILVLEKNSETYPESTHKIGESVSEIGAHYLREVVGLSNYLENNHLKKFGFRFFFSDDTKKPFCERVEIGAKNGHPFPSHQIDRGILENYLISSLEKEVQIERGVQIIGLVINNLKHKITVSSINGNSAYHSKWFVDASGRRGFLRQKLNLKIELQHQINAVWFRIKQNINVTNWSENQSWKDLLPDGKRRLSTNHVMGIGYWIWIIPLISGSTSIGLVTDPNYVSFSKVNNLEKMMGWLELNEPYVFDRLKDTIEDVLDFKSMQNFSYGCKQFYSSDRWCLTGDAGAFSDPFYSPGTDFIGFNNSWITDLIKKDLEGESLILRTKVYEHVHQELINGWMLLYRGKYHVFGKTQVMLFKILWDWTTYWSVPAKMFMNGGYKDLWVLKKYSSEEIGVKFDSLNKRMQEFFSDWGKEEDTEKAIEAKFVNIFSVPFLKTFHEDLKVNDNKDQLIIKVQNNIEKLERIAAGMKYIVFNHFKRLELDTKIDPYAMNYNDNLELLSLKSNSKFAVKSDKNMIDAIKNVWLY